MYSIRQVLVILSVFFSCINCVVCQGNAPGTENSGSQTSSITQDSIRIYLFQLNERQSYFELKYDSLANAFDRYNYLIDSIHQLMIQIDYYSNLDSLNKSKIEGLNRVIAGLNSDLIESRNKLNEEKKSTSIFLESVIREVLKSDSDINPDLLNLLERNLQNVSISMSQAYSEYKELYDVIIEAKKILNLSYSELQVNNMLNALSSLDNRKKVKYPALNYEINNIINKLKSYSRYTCLLNQIIQDIVGDPRYDTTEKVQAGLRKERWQFIEYPFLLTAWEKFYNDNSYRLPVTVECR